MTGEQTDAYIAGRLHIRGQRELTREESDAALANLRMSLGMPAEEPDALRRGRVALGLEEDPAGELGI
jgi:lipase chaperone LimK